MTTALLIIIGLLVVYIGVLVYTQKLVIREKEEARKTNVNLTVHIFETARGKFRLINESLNHICTRHGLLTRGRVINWIYPDNDDEIDQIKCLLESDLDLPSEI